MVGNEVDMPIAWGGTVGDYVKCYRQARRQILGASPSSQVLCAGFGGIELDTTEVAMIDSLAPPARNPLRADSYSTSMIRFLRIRNSYAL